MAYKIIDCFREYPHRYSLTVRTGCSSQSCLIVIQCNPSTARENASDPTVGKVSLWAEENDFYEVVFLNLFAYISSQKATLEGKGYDHLVGPQNDDVIAHYIKNGNLVVLAWGGKLPVPNRSYQQRLKEIKQLFDDAVVTPNHVGKLSYGKYPRHGRAWNMDNRKLSVLDWNAIIA